MRIHIGTGVFDVVSMSPDGKRIEQYIGASWVPTGFAIGAVGTLKKITNLKTGDVKYGMDSPDGVPGNSNPKILRRHGWRGTTCDQEVDALGVRKVKSIRPLKRGGFSVELSEDLAPDLP